MRREKKGFIDWMREASLDIGSLHNVEAEQIILGCIMAENSEYFKLKDFDSAYFYEPVHERIYRALEVNILAGSPANPVILKPLFENDQSLKDIGGAGYLVKITSLSQGILQLVDYAQAVKDLHLKRVMFMRAKEWFESLCNPPEWKPVDDYADEMYSILGDISIGAKKHAYESFQKVSSRVVEDMEKELTCFSTGIGRLDRAYGGGLYPTRVYALAAPPKGGKTVLLSTISMNLAKRDTAHVYIACEMGAKQIMERNMARDAGYNSMAFVNKRKDDKFIDGIIRFNHEAKKNCFFVDAPGCTLEEFKRIVMTGIKRHGIKGVVLDYFSLIKCSDKRKNTVEHQEEVAAWMGEIVRKEGIWMLTAAQLKEDGKVRGGSALEMAVDQLHNMHYDKESKTGWMECRAARYTPFTDVGSKDVAGLRMHKNGPHFKDADDLADGDIDITGLHL